MMSEVEKKATFGWERIGDRFYRKTELYRDIFDPDLELENFTVTGAPFSGAVGKHPFMQALR